MRRDYEGYKGDGEGVLEHYEVGADPLANGPVATVRPARCCQASAGCILPRMGSTWQPLRILHKEFRCAMNMKVERPEGRDLASWRTAEQRRNDDRDKDGVRRRTETNLRNRRNGASFEAAYPARMSANVNSPASVRAIESSLRVRS
jgi:hypothetical protein